MDNSINRKRERDTALDGVKGIAIIIVMIGHCIVLNGLNEDDPYIYDAIKSVQMPLFMFISGIVAARGSLGINKLKSRAFSYMVPFFSWFVLSFFIARIRDALRGLEVTLSPGVFFSEFAALLFQTDRGLWFLSTLFVVTVAMTVSECLARRLAAGLKPGRIAADEDRAHGDKGNATEYYRIALTAVFAGVFYLFFLIQSRFLPPFLSPGLTVLYMPFYVLSYLGQSVASLRGKKVSAPKLKYLQAALIAASSIVFLLFIIAFDLTAAADSVSVFCLQEFASLTGTLGVFAIGYHVLRKAQNARFLPFIGRYTLEIYVLHFRFARLLRIGEKGLLFYSVQGLMWTTLTFLLMSILTALCIFVLKKIPGCDPILFGKRGKAGKRAK